jgi:hypothetical protein
VVVDVVEREVQRAFLPCARDQVEPDEEQVEVEVPAGGPDGLDGLVLLSAFLEPAECQSQKRQDE